MKAILLLPFLCAPSSGADALPVTNPAKAVVQASGQVKKPGTIEISSEMTVVQAIAAAGGITELGTMKRVALTRDGKTTRHNFSTAGEKEFKVKAGDTFEVLTVCSGPLGSKS